MSSDHEEWVEVTGDVLVTTERAVKFYDGKKTVWLPLSQIHETTDATTGARSFAVPDWLARKAGLV